MKKIISYCLIVVICMTFITTSTPVHAAAYQTYVTRGLKFLCWSKCTIDWSTNSEKITSYDTQQQRSGILVVLKGCKKLNKSTTTYYINSTTELLVGAQISGTTIGWATTVVDQCKITKSGTCNWSLGI